jgi:hypothetical protein
MLYMILIKASIRSEMKLIPQKDLLIQMDAYNDMIEQAGIKIMAKGLHPTSDAIRISFLHNEKIIKKGPFLPESEQLAGFFIIDVNHEDEAVDWFHKVPDPIGENQGLIELRKIY